MNTKQRVAVLVIAVGVLLVPGGVAGPDDGQTQQRLDQLEADVGGVQASVDSFFDVFTKLEHGVDEANEEIAAHEAAVGGLMARVDAHEQSIDSFFDVFTDLNTQAQGLDARLAGLEGQLVALSQTVDSFFDVFTDISMPPAPMAHEPTTLLIDGIPGESDDAGHEGEIDVDSWGWGETQSTTTGGSGAGAGKVTMQDFSFVMRSSSATPKLMLACATGQHFAEAKLTVRKAGGTQQEYLIVTMKDLLVSSFQTGGGAQGGDAIPTDQISLNFAQIEVEYKPQRADGTFGPSIKTGYDLRTAREV